MILSFFFHHSNRFIHEPVTFRPRFKNPDTHGISAVVNRLQLVIDLTDFLWNLHFDADHAEPLFPFNRQACGVRSNNRRNLCGVASQ